MAPVVHAAPTAVQMPPMSPADKYKTYVRSNSNPNPQFDDNLKEPNNNNPNFKIPNISNNKNNSSSIKNFQDGAPQFFTCYTSYSCTPTEVKPVQSNQKSTESPQKIVQANQGKPQVGFVPNNNQLNKVEGGKTGPNAQFNNVKNTQLPQAHQIKPNVPSVHPNQMNQTEQTIKLKDIECGKPSPHAIVNNVKNIPRNPSPLIMVNDVTSQQSPPQRIPPKPAGSGKPSGQYGLAHSRSSPAISSKSPSQNESLVLHYFQNPHTYKVLQENQLPGQGPVPKSMLPPPAPPASKSKSTSPRNSFNEKRGSVPNAKSGGDPKTQEWEKVLTKFYQW